MDLHFTSETASPEERAAIDDLLGQPESDSQATDRADSGGKSRDGRRHLLLPGLHAIQGRIGWISPGALNYLCKQLQVPPAEAYGVASFYALFSTEPQPPMVVHVCDDIACMTNGADAICHELESRLGAPGSPSKDRKTTWKRSPCLGLCDKAPAAFCQVVSSEYEDFSVSPISTEQILELLAGKKRRGGDGERGRQGTSDPTHVAQHRTPNTQNPTLYTLDPTPYTLHALSARIGIVDPASLDDYRSHRGYEALRRALEIGPAEVIREVTDAKLTGRGGAAFPAGIKWKAVAEAPVRPHYVVCNADESEPGTFKDRVLMEDDPFAVIESMTIAGFACGAEKGWIYIRGEYPEATLRLQHAIDRARIRGYLGEDILGKGFTFEIDIRRGAGAYICGEETALLNSIEGFRGEPRNKPPFPVQVGLFGKPTAINNVETLVNVLPILAEGGPVYASTGSANSTGTRLFCLSGCIERPGVYEVPYGVTLRDVLEIAGGVRGGRPLQAILLGGAAGVFVGPDDLDMPLTLEGARAANATLGSGVIMVFDDTVDLKQILLRIAAFFRDESCGQCVPCRVGTVRQEEALHRLIHANSNGIDIGLLAELEQVMKDASICGLGHTAASAIQSAIHRLGLFDSHPLQSRA